MISIELQHEFVCVVMVAQMQLMLEPGEISLRIDTTSKGETTNFEITRTSSSDGKDFNRIIYNNKQESIARTTFRI